MCIIYRPLYQTLPFFLLLFLVHLPEEVDSVGGGELSLEKDASLVLKNVAGRKTDARLAGMTDDGGQKTSGRYVRKPERRLHLKTAEL